MSTHEARTGSGMSRQMRDYWELKADPLAYAAFRDKRLSRFRRKKAEDPAWYEERKRLARIADRRRRRVRLVKKMRRQAVETAARIKSINPEAVARATEPMAAAKAIRARLLRAYGFTTDELKDTSRRWSDLVACRWHIVAEVRQIAPHWPLTKLGAIAGMRDHTSVKYALEHLQSRKFLRSKRTLA
jgi:chromosomal replication initiation ATPase DnaA